MQRLGVLNAVLGPSKCVLRPSKCVLPLSKCVLYETARAADQEGAPELLGSFRQNTGVLAVSCLRRTLGGYGTSVLLW